MSKNQDFGKFDKFTGDKHQKPSAKHQTIVTLAITSNIRGQNPKAVVIK